MSKYSSYVTSYDVLKTVALILMVIDHVGQYFMPDVVELRLIGRLSAPIWLFLIGYARSRGDLMLLLGVGAAVQLSHILTDDSWWYLDILFLMALARWSLDWVMGQVLSSRVKAILIGVGLAVLALPSWFFVMYGSAGYMIVMLGYMMRHRTEDPRITDGLLYGYAGLTYVSYIVCTLAGFAGMDAYVQSLMFGVFGLFVMLFFFRPVQFSMPLQSVMGFVLRLGGRYSLYVYAIHLIAFRFISALL